MLLRSSLRLLIVSVFAFAMVLCDCDTYAKPDPIRIGLVMPQTGLLGVVGRQAVAGAMLYVAQNGNEVAGRRIELVVKDDQSSPEISKRIVQELITSENISILGAGITPNVLAIAALATESKTPIVIMISGTSAVIERSPFFVRTSWTHAQQASVLATYVAANGAKKVTMIYSDWAPGAEASGVFANIYRKAGGAIIDTIKVPLTTVDFSPYLQRARDDAPDTLFVFIPSSQAAIFAKQFDERGLDKLGIKLIGPGDISDDQDLPGMNDAMVGTLTAGFYSSSHESPLNKSFVKAYRKANHDLDPNFISVSGYDGMHLIYEALKKTGGKTDGEAFIAAVKGMAWESPRGAVYIDPDTRDIVQTIYIRKVEKVSGRLQNVEFQSFKNVKDPLHK